jgi:hypothetical protein
VFNRVFLQLPPGFALVRGVYVPPGWVPVQSFPYQQPTRPMHALAPEFAPGANVHVTLRMLRGEDPDYNGPTPLRDVPDGNIIGYAAGQMMTAEAMVQTGPATEENLSDGAEREKQHED